MYIHIGNNYVLRTDEIVGIFDLDNTTISARTRLFLSKSEKKGNIVLTGNELPKSFIVTNRDNKVFLSQLATNTLSKRTIVKRTKI